MMGRFPSAQSYEQAGKDMFSKPLSLSGMVEIPPHPSPTDQRQQMVMRWDKSTHDFATGDPSTKRLATFHTRTPEQFLEAVSQQRPDVLPRVIKFESGK
ncbi:MAG: hypothetical protein JNM52_08685 [Betaproteobacteria bacterium]|nr:hypothetical protein [Betaproteobacteria bacterium]